MKLIDLTHMIHEGMPVFPGTPSPVLEASSTCERDGYSETKLVLYTHTGTHADPPAHIFAGRTELDAFPIEQFFGKALVIDCRGCETIGMERLAPYGEKVSSAVFLLFRTDWDRYWGTDDYFRGYPCIDDEVLELILAGDYKGIGFDTMSLDPVDHEPIARHKKLFREKDIINLENLTCLGECGDELFDFSCFPLKLEHNGGAPVRAVAFLPEA